MTNECKKWLLELASKQISLASLEKMRPSYLPLELQQQFSVWEHYDFSLDYRLELKQASNVLQLFKNGFILLLLLLLNFVVGGMEN